MFRLSVMFTEASGVYEAALRIPWYAREIQEAYGNAAPYNRVPASLDQADELTLEAGNAMRRFSELVRKAVYGEVESGSLPTTGRERTTSRTAPVIDFLVESIRVERTGRTNAARRYAGSTGAETGTTRAWWARRSASRSIARTGRSEGDHLVVTLVVTAYAARPAILARRVVQP
jgi:hypothetical protein